MTDASEEGRLPTWAPRVEQARIRRLYEQDARGIRDEERQDDVGIALLCRCEAFVAANEARAGRVVCPECSQVVAREEMMRCGGCGWQLSWKAYFKTIQHKQLSGAEPVLEQFRGFARAYPRARSAAEKMILIDQLLHGFHWYAARQHVTRPVAVNLIEGRLREVVVFLDSLSYGEQSVPGWAERRAEWHRGVESNRSWYPELGRRPRSAGGAGRGKAPEE